MDVVSLVTTPMDHSWVLPWSLTELSETSYSNNIPCPRVAQV